MRRPTPDEVLYLWHTKTMAYIALNGEADRKRPAVTEGDPQCGWFRRRLVPKGPWVPAKIFVEREIDAETGELLSDEVLRCEVDGRRVDVAQQWTWLCGHPITEDAYMDMLAGRFSFAQDPAPDSKQQPDMGGILRRATTPEPCPGPAAVKTEF